MAREPIGDLVAFVAVARERSFTRAAAQLGVSPSALSHTMRRLEAGIGVRLLTRTTRSVGITDAGERLLSTVAPHFDDIRAEIAALAELRARPAGNIRITASQHAVDTILWTAIEGLLRAYPDIHVELSVDSGFTDIVTHRFDVGVRLGEAIAKDMIAVPIGPELRMAVVGSPAYFAARAAPRTPQDLAAHDCINLRMLSSGGFYAWELEKAGREVRVRVEGQLAFDNIQMVARAATAGFGLAFVMENQVAAEIADGRLIRVLDDWCPSFSGYRLYYPSRRQPSAAFSLLVETLRFRG
jgi:DNA-binding transcriptional LysR family regulator